MTHPAAIEGANRAAAKADRACSQWSDRALDFLKRWASLRGKEPFMTEDVRMAAEESDTYVPPPDGRAWGAVILRAKAQGLVTHLTYAPNKDPSCHGSPKSVWLWVA